MTIVDFCPFISYMGLGTRSISWMVPTYLRLKLYHDLLSRGMSDPCFYPPSFLLSHTRRTSVKEPLPRVPTALSSEDSRAYSNVSVSGSPFVGPITSSTRLGFYSDPGASA